MPYTKIWGSLSLLTGVVIAVLALARGAWQLWLLLAVFAVWGLWLVLTVLLPYAAARRRQRKAYRQAEERQPAADSEVGQIPPNEQPVDPRIWYEVQGRKVLEGLISDLHSRGHSGLEIGEDGSIHVEDAEEDAHTALPSFPEKVYWPQLVKVLEGEGYAAEVKEDAVAVTW